MNSKTLRQFFLLLTVFTLSAQFIFAQTPQRRRASQEVRTVHFDDLRMSDPYILADPVTKMYYLTSSGGRMWKSEDLKMWTGPYNIIDIDPNSWMGGSPSIWAAELHYYQGKYYYCATFTNSDIIIEKVPMRYDIERRASHILVSDKVDGPYKVMNDELYTPDDQSTLDGTLYVEDGVPYFVYCHEWMQIVDGTMDVVQLKPDLSGTVGEAKTLFRATSADWAAEMNSIEEITFGVELPGWVTDAPELFRTQTGKLGMLWSSWGEHQYAQGVAYSASGKISGPWIQEEDALIGDNAGHGMLFRTFEGKLLLVIHYASLANGRKPIFFEVDDSGDKIKVLNRYNP
ncbi:MAG TPA: glycoside hydrolase family 43 protein [Draconibacterium sp.]|nr:glycoside hydrolase family 43 protein [Draconibacterium sp.]